MSLRSEVVRIFNELLAGSKKISELPDATTPLAGTEQIELKQGGNSVKTTVSNIGGGGGGSGTVTTVSVTTANGISGSVTNPTTTPAISLNVSGTQDLFIPAAAMWPQATNGCENLTRHEMATSLVNVQSLDFDQTTQEFAQIQLVFPRKWNLGTLTVVPYWTAISGSGTVQWGISGGAYSNDDALTVALGSAQTSDDTLIATNDLHIGPATSAITLAGTPASADFLILRVSRNPASDTLNADALLLGISVRLTVSGAVDA